MTGVPLDTEPQGPPCDLPPPTVLQSFFGRPSRGSVRFGRVSTATSPRFEADTPIKRVGHQPPTVSAFAGLTV